MAKFLTGSKLNSELEDILEKAHEHINLISPFIKLHDRYARILQTKMSNPKLKISVVFGKNEEDYSKSMKEEDFKFFKEFPNIEIRYEKLLHAKYYANEYAAILSSMNLYSYSQDNNIEAGVMTKTSILGSIGLDSLDREAYDYFERVINQSELLFKKEPEWDKGTLGTGLNKKYLKSNVKVDLLSDFFEKRKKAQKENKKKEKVEVQKNKEVANGYCIRTGVKIPFSIDKPMTEEAHRVWSKYKDGNYSEKYCHFSGEESNGETCYNKPVLAKNWKKAKEEFNL